MNMFLHEMKMSYKSFLAYTIGMLATFFIFLSFFDSLAGKTHTLNEVLANFPKEFKSALGISNVDLSNINGYCSFLFNYLYLIGGIFSLKLSISLLSEEIRSKTADFLLSKPVNRRQIMGSKFLTVLSFILLQDVLVFSICLIPLNLLASRDDLQFRTYLLLSLSLCLIQLFFMGIGFLISAIFKKIKSVMPITLGVVFLFFIINLVNESIGEKALTYITPFSYFKGASILENGELEFVYILLTFMVFVFGSLAASIIYNKKDIPSV